MAADRKSQLIAWVCIAIASDIADICCYLHTGHRMPLLAALVRAFLLLPLAFIARSHLRGFVITLIAFLAGSWLERTIEAHWPWFQQASVANRMFADAFIALIPSAFIALTLIGSRRTGFALSRKDIFLTPGNLNARVAGLGPIRWTILGPAVIVFMIFGLSQQLKFILGNVHAADHPNLFRTALLAVTFAGINAFNEEFRFRFVLLAHGSRAAGAGAALWMTSLNFGLAHWITGHPGGPTGAFTTTLFALLLCRSIYDTRGGLWAWLIHVGGDIIILAVVLFRVG